MLSQHRQDFMDRGPFIVDVSPFKLVLNSRVSSQRGNFCGVQFIDVARQTIQECPERRAE